MEMTLENMIDTLVIYYEAAGYDDFYEREIKGHKEEEIYELYKATFPDDMIL